MFQSELDTFDVDDGALVEKDFVLPVMTEPSASWVYYECTVGVMLDSGIVVHNRLPQVNNLPDTISMCDIDAPNLDTLTTGGVNLKCMDQYADIVQRMGHARYWFRLWGQALRFKHQIPIPAIVSIGGVKAIPYDLNPQWGFNRIVPGGNYGGVILWHAVWSLWYTTASPPRGSRTPAVDLAAHIREDAVQPDSMQAPFSQPDDDAVQAFSQAPGSTAGTGSVFNNARFGD